ncbi:hypothetical protein J2S08_003719 [Bacillus chungangensis]|uniref:Uncharacterized protein n=1 Tax=Bacillus chungangensis TaxID=587633 RepID=A0ABT9WXH7_9BACI|nr:hypothetical protein [Bacillus chungangensis]
MNLLVGAVQALKMKLPSPNREMIMPFQVNIKRKDTLLKRLKD